MKKKAEDLIERATYILIHIAEVKKSEEKERLRIEKAKQETKKKNEAEERTFYKGFQTSKIVYNKQIENMIENLEDYFSDLGRFYFIK